VRARPTGPTLAGLATPVEVTLGPPVEAAMTLARVRGEPPRLLLSFEGVEDREAAARLTKATIEVPAVALPELDEDEFYVRDLLGCDVEAGGEVVGRVADVLSRPANDVVVVRSAAGEELMLPFVPEVVLEVDLAAGVVRVAALPEADA
jgi:16S rRNA processing protein RimM